MLNVDVAQLLGMAVRDQAAGRTQRAEALYREILRQQPEHLDVLRLLSGLLYEAYRNEEALTLMRQAEVLAPQLAWVHNNMGNSLRELRRSEEAAAAFKQALQLSETAETHNNLGLVYMDMRRLQEAVVCWRKALAMKPDLADAHWNMSLTLLALGEMEEGWQHYEWRARR